MQLNDDEVRYIAYVLRGWEGEVPATIEGNVLTFTTADGKAVLLEEVQQEALYDKSCGVPTAGAELAERIAAL